MKIATWNVNSIRAREERLQELRRRIKHEMYDVDSARIAEGLLARGDLSELDDD